MDPRLRGDDEMLFMKCSTGIANSVEEIRELILRDTDGHTTYLGMEQYVHRGTSFMSAKCSDTLRTTPYTFVNIPFNPYRSCVLCITVTHKQ